MQSAPELPKFDHGSISNEMRADAARMSQSSNNWTMAALITVNGGAVVTMLSKGEPGIAMAIALALFVLGITFALVAGRFAASLANSEAALHIASSHAQRASSYLASIMERGNPAQIHYADEFVQEAMKGMEKVKGDHDKAPTPDLPLGLGVVSFFLGCIASGFALF